MSKRFFDTEMFLRPWYRALEPRLKCLWTFMLSRCDMAGVIDMDWQLASWTIGQSVSEDDMKAMNGNVVRLQSGKLFIPGFIDFQYGHLNRDSRVHAAVFKVLDTHSIPYPYPMDTLSELSYRVAATPKDKDKEKDKDKDKANTHAERFTIPTPEEVAEYASEIGYPMDGAAWCDSYAQKGWMVGKAKMKDWKAAVRNWKRNGWMPNGAAKSAAYDDLPDMRPEGAIL